MAFSHTARLGPAASTHTARRRWRKQEAALASPAAPGTAALTAAAHLTISQSRAGSAPLARAAPITAAAHMGCGTSGTLGSNGSRRPAGTGTSSSGAELATGRVRIQAVHSCCTRRHLSMRSTRRQCRRAPFGGAAASGKSGSHSPSGTGESSTERPLYRLLTRRPSERTLDPIGPGVPATELTSPSCPPPDASSSSPPA